MATRKEITGKDTLRHFDKDIRAEDESISDNIVFMSAKSAGNIPFDKEPFSVCGRRRKKGQPFGDVSSSRARDILGQSDVQ